MKFDEPISYEQLNTFLDNELADSDRARILSALREDKALSDELACLHQINDLISLAYQDVPPAPQKSPAPRSRYALFPRLAAMITLLVLGSALGWWFHQPRVANPVLPFTSLSQLNLAHPSDDKILIHINAMDDKRISNVLNDTEQLLSNARKDGKHLQLEIVANASGLGMLRQGSPYAQRIHEIAAANHNVSFLACGFAMENARLKEGQDIKLIHDAHKVDAALEQILRRLKAGWLYVRG
ncbi:MAG: hypothetical protein GC149_11285 [Gammaproteobacteria bacterium]|nr:hypothetical protein [Gammaproteobacteria bacterium]